MKYRIEYSRCKTDRWGHILPSPLYVDYAESLPEAECKALGISAKYKKYDVNVLDMEGPNSDGDIVWCIKGYKAGRHIMTNYEYFELINKKQIK